MRTALVFCLLMIPMVGCANQVQTYEQASLAYQDFGNAVLANIDTLTPDQRGQLAEVDQALYLSLHAWGAALIRDQSPADAARKFNAAWVKWLKLAEGL